MHIFAISFLALYLAHLVTDFVLQSRRVVMGKRRGALLAYTEHGGIHLLLAAWFLGFAVPGLWRERGVYEGVLGLTLLHLGGDWSKVPVGRSVQVSDGAGLFFLDQAVHLVTVAMAAWIVARPSAAALLAQLRWFQSETERP